MGPIAVEVWRGDRVESRHAVAAAVVDADGSIALAAGDLERPIYPRSAIKPFQALALVESGAADALEATDAELALACASHSGTPAHTEPVTGWLDRLGLPEAALACGPQRPIHDASADALMRRGLPPRRVHNNCSGKHTGMLAACRHAGWPVAGYERLDHPLQRWIASALTDLAGEELVPDPAIDGCSLPAHAMTLSGLATAAARLAEPTSLPAARARALRRIGAAMSAHPELVGGPGRSDTALMRSIPALISKTGAEGVYLAALPNLGLGIALKVEDGAGRAASVALVALLNRLGALTEVVDGALGELAQPIVRDWNGRPVGRIRPAPGWPGP